MRVRVRVRAPSLLRGHVRAREAGERAAFRRHDAPLLARLPEAVVRGVGAEHQQQAQRAAEQRVRQRDDRGPHAAGRLDRGVDHANDQGDADVEDERALDAPENERSRQRAQVTRPVDRGVPHRRVVRGREALH